MNKTKIFIAQPIKGIPKDEIGAVKLGILNKINEGLSDDNQYEFVLGTEYLEPGESDLMHLGNMITDICNANVVVFAPGWEKDAECQVLWTVCNVYDLEYLEFDKFYL